MSYAAISSLGTTPQEAAAAARRRAQAAGMAALNSPASSSLPQCIPEQYRQAAQNFCIERMTVAGLGAVDWTLPLEYQSDPCGAEQLPPCPSGQEPQLTLPAQPAATSAPALTTTSASAPPPVQVATVKPNYLMWGLIGGAGLLALLVWRASK